MNGNGESEIKIRQTGLSDNKISFLAAPPLAIRCPGGRLRSKTNQKRPFFGAFDEETGRVLPAVGNPAAKHAIPEVDEARAEVYGLLAKLLSNPPSTKDLAAIARVSGDESDLGVAIGTLSKLASSRSAEQCEREYHELFIGLGRGELVPYASYYLTGFLHEKPLARLRGDMERLGIVRSAEVKEPEDHIAALCDMMAGLIRGEFDAPADIETQRGFFKSHLAPWARHFFRDLASARNSVLYAPVGELGRVFMDIEDVAFAME